MLHKNKINRCWLLHVVRWSRCAVLGQNKLYQTAQKPIIINAHLTVLKFYLNSDFF